MGHLPENFELGTLAGSLAGTGFKIAQTENNSGEWMAKAQPQGEAESASDAAQIAESSRTYTFLPRVPRLLLEHCREHSPWNLSEKLSDGRTVRGALGCASSIFFGIDLQMGELS